MKKLVLGLFLLAATSSLIPTVSAEQMTLEATKDNSMYAEAPGNSNGLGDHVVAGKAGGASSVRRGLIAFDLTALPSPIRIDRAALELVFQGATNMESDSRAISLHRVLSDWGEGTSDSGPGGTSGAGNGAAATTNDATWRYRFYDAQTWSSYDPAIPLSGGGDFVGEPSAIATVGIDPGVLVTWETTRNGPASGLVGDVEEWLANPSTSYGWLVKVADESPIRTARRFYSKDAANAAFHPRLVIDYTVVPEPATLTTLAIAASFVICAPRRLSKTLLAHSSRDGNPIKRWVALKC